MKDHVLNPGEQRIADALKPFGWTCGPHFWSRYYSDPWVFNLANAVERLAEENAQLRRHLGCEDVGCKEAHLPPMTTRSAPEPHMTAGYPPTHPFCGTNPERQRVGDPGHCERCAEVGHVMAHPDLGCGDVGCDRAHPEERPLVTKTGRVLTDADLAVLAAEAERGYCVVSDEAGNFCAEALPCSLHPPSDPPKGRPPD